MLVKIVNPWTYNKLNFQRNDLVEMSEELYSHVKEVSIAEAVTTPRERRLFDALVNGVPVSDSIKEQIGFQESEERYHFKLDYEIDGAQRFLYYAVLKDKARQVVE